MDSHKAMSIEMNQCLDRIEEHGTITRYRGGFWCADTDSSGRTFGTTTVEALVKRGRLEYCDWKQPPGRKFPFPIKAKRI